MRTLKKERQKLPFFEALESRQMLTATVNIVGSNTATELLEVHLNKGGVIKVNRNGSWSSMRVGYDTIVNVRSGAYAAGATTVDGVPSKGKHTIKIFANAPIVKGVDIFATQDSVNHVNVNVYSNVRVKGFGGWRSANYMSSTVTDTRADVWLFGGKKSSNYLTSLYGKTKMKGGDYSANFITNKVGGDQLIGGNFSSNYLTVCNGNNTLFGGNNSKNVFNVKGGTGWMKSGGYSSNTVYTATGTKPSGFVFDTSNGAFVFKKA